MLFGITVSCLPGPIMGRLGVSLQVLLMYTEIALLIYLLLQINQGTTEWWYLTMEIAVSVFLVNVCSIFRVKQTMDFFRKKISLLVCIIMHMLFVGPLWRYGKLLSVYEQADFDDFMKLKLLGTSISSIPVLIYVTNIYIHENQPHWMYTAYMVVSFINIVFTFTFVSPSSEKDSLKSSILGTACCLLWRTFSLFARISTLVWALDEDYLVWVIIALIAHFLLMLIWFQVQDVSNEYDCTPYKVWLVLISLAHTVDLVESDFGLSVSWLTAFYSLIFSEHIASIVLHYYSEIYQTGENFFDLLWISTVLATFALGLLLSIASLAIRDGNRHKSLTQKAIRCCCPGSKRDRIDKASFIWDSYDTRSSGLLRSIQSKSEHEGANEQLFSRAGSSLTPTANKASYGTYSKASEPNEPNVHQIVAVDVTPAKSTDLNGQCYSTVSTLLPEPFYLSSTGLRAKPCDLGASRPIEHSSFRLKINKPVKPRRRLLFLTPSGLQSYPNSEHEDKPVKPKWVDLNKYYNELEELNRVSRELSGAHNLTKSNREKSEVVMEWLGKTEKELQSQIGVTKLNKVDDQLETRL